MSRSTTGGLLYAALMRPEVRDVAQVLRFAALENETRAAGRLGAEAMRLLSRFRGPLVDADPLFACLSLGMEKLLKLTVGLSAENTTGEWPADIRGHAIPQLDDRARGYLRQNFGQATHPKYVQDLLQTVDDDPWIDRILNAVTRYAERGRFYNLDSLGHKPQTEASPVELWSKLESAIVQADPAFVETLLQTGSASPVNGAIATSVRLWWELYWRAWIQGALGDEARRFGPQLAIEFNA